MKSVELASPFIIRYPCNGQDLGSSYNRVSWHVHGYIFTSNQFSSYEHELQLTEIVSLMESATHSDVKHKCHETKCHEKKCIPFISP